MNKLFCKKTYFCIFIIIIIEAKNIILICKFFESHNQRVFSDAKNSNKISQSIFAAISHDTLYYAPKVCWLAKRSKIYF